MGDLELKFKMINILLLILSTSSGASMLDPKDLIEGADTNHQNAYQAVFKEISTWAKRNNPKTVKAVIENNLPTEREKFITNLNKMLSFYKMPLVENSSKLVIKRSCMIGFVPENNCFHGLEIDDGKNFFCFGCEMGHNHFGLGIRPAKKSEANKVIFNRGPKRSQGRN